MAASSPLSLSLIFNPKPPNSLPPLNSSSSHHAPILAFSPAQSYRLNSQTKKTTKIWKRSAINENFWVSEANTVDNSQDIVTTTSDDGVSNIISTLLLFAFIGLSILTIGVVYIAVTDFLQKREREKFEKDEGAKKKKKTKKGKVMRGRSSGGPKGFGQKVEEEDDDEED